MSDEFMNEEEKNKRRAVSFLKEKIKVHILKKNATFYNGIIIRVDGDFFVIADRVEGNKIVHFFELAEPIEEFKEVEE